VNAPRPTSPPPPGLEVAYSVGSSDSAVVASVSTGIVRSTDGGASWALLDPTRVREFAANGATLYAASNGGVLGSHDSGLHWFLAAPPSGPPLVPAWGFASIGDQIFAIGDFDGVWRSSDHGAHWQRVSTGLPATRLHHLAASNGVLVGITTTQVYRSNDGGENWVLLSGLPTDFPFGFAGGAGEFFLVDAFGPAFVSHDDGDTWIPTSGELPGPLEVRKAILLAGALYVTTDRGLFRTADGGASWQHLAVGSSPATVVNDVTEHGGALYAATDREGVQRSDDGGNVWRRVDATGGGSLP
jgi:photosystem II stability/assembly factor-like uncharacterized protein